MNVMAFSCPHMASITCPSNVAEFVGLMQLQQLMLHDCTVVIVHPSCYSTNVCLSAQLKSNKYFIQRVYCYLYGTIQC